MKSFSTIFLCFLLSSALSSFAQDLTQHIRGKVVDKESQASLEGAKIALLSLQPVQGAYSDREGLFRIQNVPVGRHTIEISFVGYESRILNNVLLNSGKELVLRVELIESPIQMDEVLILSETQQDKTQPLNEFASLSARTFSVEETGRYAFSAFDPARMAQNYAGVSIGSTGDDLFNEIVIRGNSPSGVLWRLEGIQIPNPNHFGAMGNSGGAISMLSSSILANSDFYTGAFPAEFGNALSGVFDLNLRNGNNEQREFSFMLGALGIELAAEGPFSKNSRASYLVNYRYSTLAALDAVGLSPAGDILPSYQDLSFKINVPTKRAGVFALFGLGGKNLADNPPDADSTLWTNEFDKYGDFEAQDVGTIGLSHRILLTNNSYLKTVAIASHERVRYEEFLLDAPNNYEKIIDYRDDIQQNTLRLSTSYNLKINARNSLRTGLILSQHEFAFFSDNRHQETDELVREFDNTGDADLVQIFAQMKSRLNTQLTLRYGLHYTRMGLNGKSSLEPRVSLQWKLRPQHTLAGSVGFHSKMEHPAIYLFEGTRENGTQIRAKKNLGLSKAFHAILGYDWVISPDLRLKTEVYYQHLYNIPISTKDDELGIFSILNATDVWGVFNLPAAESGGTGQNVGIDLTLEKFFSQNYYFLLTGSLFNSTYVPQNGNTYNTRFNGNTQLNILGGKEFVLGNKKARHNILGINGKFILAGGARITPIDLEASRMRGFTVLLLDRPYDELAGTYSRFDLGISYRINKKRTTHTIMFDIQNLTNRLNVARKFYNRFTENIGVDTQTGFFPIFNYRIEF